MATIALKLDHPTEPMAYDDAIEYTENWLAENALTQDERDRGVECRIYDYHDGNAGGLKKRPWTGVRVAEVSFHIPGRGGGSYMQVDAPWGIAVCGQVERCILALIENWNEDAQIKVKSYGGKNQEYKDMAVTDEEFWRLGHLFKTMQKED